MLIKKRFVMGMTHACIICVSLLPFSAHAINFAVGAKAPSGYHFSLYPFYYSAAIRTNKDGNPSVNDLGMGKCGIAIGNSFYVGDFLLNAIIPFGKLELDKLKSDDSGVGDIQLRVGWFLPMEWANVLPALMVKVPTGGFDKNHKANMGDGQTDLVTELFLHKIIQPLSFDAVLKYNFRFRNPDSDVTPGNEFIAEGLVTWRLAERIRFGPAVNFLIGKDNKKAGKTLADSGLMRFSAGGEVWYGRFDHVKISLAAYQDVVTRNTNEGVTVMSRLAFKF